MDRSDNPKPLPEDIRLAIERLKKVHAGVTHNISPEALSRLPAHVLRTVLKLRKESKRMSTRLTAAAKIKTAHPRKKGLIRIDEILEIHPDETLRASLSPEEMKELIYRKCEPDEDKDIG
jgi:hypothetical protein